MGWAFIVTIDTGWSVPIAQPADTECRWAFVEHFLRCDTRHLSVALLLRGSSSLLGWIPCSILMQSLIRRLWRGACLSPVWLTSYLRLSFQPPELQCTSEALCGLCRHALPSDSVHRFPNGAFNGPSDTFVRFEFGEHFQIYLLGFCSWDAVS